MAMNSHCYGCLSIAPSLVLHFYHSHIILEPISLLRDNIWKHYHKKLVAPGNLICLGTLPDKAASRTPKKRREPYPDKYDSSRAITAGGIALDAAVVRTIKPQKQSGQLLIPSDGPIGYLLANGIVLKHLA
jgi:hypothetical protein